MILAFDTYYYGDKAKTVCIGFEHWQDAAPAEIWSEITTTTSEYEPGAFYKRELPCIVSLLAKISTDNIEAIIVDGFTVLNDEEKPGLGAHLYNYLQLKTPVIGVAKTNFASLNLHKRPLLRGESQRPLFITATGIDLETATSYIAQMHGGHRIPVLLKLLDSMTRQN
ncbi:endonuclease V [Chitinophagaceae bacterium MMS25-I14]